MGAIVAVEAILISLDGLGSNGFPQFFKQDTWLDAFDLVSEGILMPLGALLMACLLYTSRCV